MKKILSWLRRWPLSPASTQAHRSTLSRPPGRPRIRIYW